MDTDLEEFAAKFQEWTIPHSADTISIMLDDFWPVMHMTLNTMLMLQRHLKCDGWSLFDVIDIYVGYPSSGRFIKVAKPPVSFGDAPMSRLMTLVPVVFVGSAPTEKDYVYILNSGTGLTDRPWVLGVKKTAVAWAEEHMKWPAERFMSRLVNASRRKFCSIAWGPVGTESLVRIIPAHALAFAKIRQDNRRTCATCGAENATSMCGGCGIFHYCSKKCQVDDRPRHKWFDRAFRAVNGSDSDAITEVASRVKSSDRAVHIRRLVDILCTIKL
jgi:hypothetical protein